MELYFDIFREFPQKKAKAISGWLKRNYPESLHFLDNSIRRIIQNAQIQQDMNANMLNGNSLYTDLLESLRVSQMGSSGFRIFMSDPIQNSRDQFWGGAVQSVREEGSLLELGWQTIIIKVAPPTVTINDLQIEIGNFLNTGFANWLSDQIM